MPEPWRCHGAELPSLLLCLPGETGRLLPGSHACRWRDPVPLRELAWGRGVFPQVLRSSHCWAVQLAPPVEARAHPGSGMTPALLLGLHETKIILSAGITQLLSL